MVIANATGARVKMNEMRYTSGMEDQEKRNCNAQLRVDDMVIYCNTTESFVQCMLPLPLAVKRHSGINDTINN